MFYVVFLPNGEARRLHVPDGLPSEVIQASAVQCYSEEMGHDIESSELHIVPEFDVHISGTVH